VTDNSGDDLLVTTVVAMAGIDDFHLPFVAFNVPLIHAKKVARKQGRFVPAGTGPDFQENIIVIVRVFG